eukprot:scaffold1944_cov241-Pinguiococcus_pyrenoidosus.AAC.21
MLISPGVRRSEAGSLQGLSIAREAAACPLTPRCRHTSIHRHRLPFKLRFDERVPLVQPCHQPSQAKRAFSALAPPRSPWLLRLVSSPHVLVGTYQRSHVHTKPRGSRT